MEITDTVLTVALLSFPAMGISIVLWWLYRLLLQRYLHNVFGTVITVTWEDIEAGKKGCGGRCPIALAITRELQKKYPDNPDVAGNISSIYNGETCNIQLFFGWSPWGDMKSRNKSEEHKHGMSQHWISYWGHPDMKKIARFACRFDIGHSAEPFSFKLLL